MPPCEGLVFQVIGCIARTHDCRLVAIACLLCGTGALATFQMLARANAVAGRIRWVWIGAAGVTFGCGVWVTHFVAVLAYQPGMPIAFSVPLSAFSLLVAVAGGCLSLACTIAGTRPASIFAGLLLGATIGTTHFAGMAALEVPGFIEYSAKEAGAAWGLGLVFGPLALLQFRAGSIQKATMLLVLAVAGLHFTAMAAITVLPGGSAVVGIATTSLALAVAAIGLLVLFASLFTALLDEHLAARAAREGERFRRFADGTFEGLFFLDRGIVSDVNGVLCRMLDRTPAQVVGAPMSSFFAPHCRAALDALQLTGIGGIEAELVDAAGGHHIVDVLTRSLAVSNDTVAVVAVRDALDRKRAEQRIQELANTDPLTGLGNRLLLRDRLAQALAMAERSASSVAVLCFDLDRFKEVNDLLGHHAGDSLLIEVANRLRATTRETDTVVRLGGDEFIVVQPFAGQPQSAQALAERLVQLLAQPYVLEGCLAEVSVSIGIALYPTDGVTSDMLLNQADLGLYRAKQEGRGCYRFFEPGMDTKLRARREMEHDLRYALSNGELHLHYQPVFDGERLELAGYEALLRWRHPKRGNVPPAEFIPLAEECGAILPIGCWVLETACAEAASWPEPRGIAVNLSPAQFKSRDLPAQIAEILARTGLAPERLELEVTEGVLIADTDRALAVLGALKAQGVRIALDDFGTGYSSLSYLRRFPFDRLKIDRSFVAKLGIDPDADAIVRAITALSRSLRLEVTAEGVETEQQLATLRFLRCNHLQGYLLGRPGPPSAIARAAEKTAAA